MTTVELEPVLDDGTEEEHDHQHDDRLVHLYQNSDVALCGLPSSKDPHNASHAWPNELVRNWLKGQLSCPVCNAPICMTCLLAAN